MIRNGISYPRLDWLSFSRSYYNGFVCLENDLFLWEWKKDCTTRFKACTNEEIHLCRYMSVDIPSTEGWFPLPKLPSHNSLLTNINSEEKKSQKIFEGSVVKLTTDERFISLKLYSNGISGSFMIRFYLLLLLFYSLVIVFYIVVRFLVFLFVIYNSSNIF